MSQPARQGRCYKQERALTCVVAALRTVLSYQFAVRVTEPALEILGNDPEFPIRAYGTDATQLRRMVKGACRALNPAQQPWTLRIYRYGAIAELGAHCAAGRYPIVRMHDPVDHVAYHVVVVLEVSAAGVLLWNPCPTTRARPEWYAPADFEAWWSGDGQTTWYAVVGGGA